MNQVLNKIESLIYSNTVWIFMAGILFSSMTITLNMNEQTWSRYLGLVLNSAVYFSPILLFAYFRDILEKRLSLPALILLWAIVFIALPSLMNNMEVYEIWEIETYDEILAIMCGTVLFSAEVAIQIARFKGYKSLGDNILKKIKLEQGILLFMVTFSIFYITMGWKHHTGGFTLSNFPSYLSSIFQVFIIISIYYFFYWVNHYILILRIWKKRGLIYYILSFAATIIVFYPIAAQLIYWLPIARTTDIHPVNNGQIFEEMNWIVPLMGMTLSTPFILMIRWLEQSKKLEEMAKEKSETELSLLKQQINPHFFFNTLNNLYALSITKDKQTPEVILQLSELMRYTIYKGKEESVKLSEEVKYIEDYIQLQQIRLHKKLDFRFDKDLEDDSIEIPPLLFINLVENAFKHGIEPAEGDTFLHLSLSSNAKELTFSCVNSLEEKVKKSDGTGLKNLRRRLDLRFPNRYELNVLEEQNKYRVNLSISL